jgi:hypothetical protein
MLIITTPNGSRRLQEQNMAKHIRVVAGEGDGACGSHLFLRYAFTL